jgi:hypothetical protein
MGNKTRRAADLFQRPDQHLRALRLLGRVRHNAAGNKGGRSEVLPSIWPTTRNGCHLAFWKAGDLFVSRGFGHCLG